MSGILGWLAAGMAVWFTATATAMGPGAGGPPLAEQAGFDGHRVVRVEMESTRDVRVMHALSDDPWTCGWDGVSPGSVDFRIAPEAMAALRESGLRYRVMIEDVQKLIDSERRAPETPVGVGVRAGSWFDDYQPLAAVSARVDELVAGSGGRATRMTVGTSVQQREIFAIGISAGPAPGGGVKPAIVINGCQHAREWITVMATMHLAERLLTEYGTDAGVTRVLDTIDWFIVPIVNVDGYEYTWQPNQRLWRKNRRDNGNGTFGVDPNRNWDAGWNTVGTSTNPSSEVYCGPSAFSEPETRALRDFLTARAAAGGLMLHVDVHSFSQLILEPNGFDFALPSDSAAFARLSAAMQEAMYAVAGKTFSPGPIYRNIYPASGGACDWTYNTLGGGALGMSLELRDEGQFGFVLPADQILPSSREMQEGLVAGAIRLLDRLVDIEFVNGEPARVPSDANTTISVRAVRGLKRPDPAMPVILHQRIGRVGPFAASNLTLAGTDEAGAVLQGTLSGGTCGSVVQYYFEVRTLDGATVLVRSHGAVGRPYEALSHTYSTLISTTLETAASATGWLTSDPTVGSADTAGTSGRWTRGDPNGTVSQAEFDHTPLAGASCFYTGANTRGNAGAGDVDGGKTTLVTPVINLSGVPDAEISFWLWFSNNRTGAATDDDLFAVDITANGSAATPAWVRAITVRSQAPIAQATGVWRKYSFRAGAFAALTNQARIRFVAADVGVGSLVEAAVDDFAVEVLTCAPASCAADWNGSGAAGVQDIFDFLAAYFAGEVAADVNGSGAVSVQDVFDFLAMYFTGC